VAELKLSAEQKESVLKMYKQNYRRNAAREAKDADPIDESATYDQRLKALLSTEQERALERLRGEVVDGKE